MDLRKRLWCSALVENGEMAERSIAAVLKTVDLRGSGGSNPSLSAKNNLKGINQVPFFHA